MNQESQLRWKARLSQTLAGAGCLLAPISPLYSAFAFQNLWNWFVSDAIHGPEVSYWQAAGILILASFLSYHDYEAYAKEKRWKRVLKLMEAIVSEEDRVKVTKTLDEDEKSWMGIILEASPGIARTVSVTFALVGGWAIHTFLM